MADGLAKTLAGVLGFGLCKTALGVAYLTAMGSVFSNVGFISELSFMTPMLVASLATASLIVLGARRGRLSPGSLKQYPAVLALSLGFLFGGANLLPGLPEDALALVCGLLCGFSSTVLNIVWLDVLSAERDVAAPTIQIIGALIVQCVLIPLAVGVDRFWAFGAPIVAVCLSALLLAYKKRGMVFPARNILAPADSPKRRDLALAYLCVFVLVGVVGIFAYRRARLAIGAFGRRCEYVGAACRRDARHAAHGDRRPQASPSDVGVSGLSAVAACGFVASALFRRCAGRTCRSYRDRLLRRLRHGVLTLHRRLFAPPRSFCLPSRGCLFGRFGSFPPCGPRHWQRIASSEC